MKTIKVDTKKAEELINKEIDILEKSNEWQDIQKRQYFVDMLNDWVIFTNLTNFVILWEQWLFLEKI